MKLKNNDGAVSEIIGTILLLAISVALFSIIYSIVLSDNAEMSSPHANIVGYVSGDNMILEHHGGDSLAEGSVIRLKIGGTITVFNVTASHLYDYNNNDEWDIGEKITYVAGLDGMQVEATVINQHSNTALFIGTLQEGATSGGGYAQNNNPINSNPNPSNGATEISITPQCSIQINDPDGNTMNITWSSNSSGSWVEFGSNNSCTNGTFYQTNSNFSGYNTRYYWKVNLSDGNGGTDVDIYYFTTSSGLISTSIDTITPYSQSPSTITINATSTGINPDNISLYYKWSSNNWSDNWNVLTYDDF